MLSRRDLIGKAAVGATAALTLGAAARTAVASTRAFQAAATDATDRRSTVPRAAEQAVASRTACDAKTSPAPWHLLAPLAAGSAIAHGWQVDDLSPVQDGSSVVTLRNERGRAHRVHLCSNDGSPQGIIYTRRVDLVLMNEGAGALPTEESLGQALAELAHVVAANEAKLPDYAVADLLPHAERLRRFAKAEAPVADGKLR